MMSIPEDGFVDSPEIVEKLAQMQLEAQAMRSKLSTYTVTSTTSRFNTHSNPPKKDVAQYKDTEYIQLD